MKRLLVPLLILLLACPLPVPVRAEEGTATPAPTAAAPGDEGTEPASTPEAAIRFVPEAGLPLPCAAYALTEKRDFAFGGTVLSDAPLHRVSAAVSDPAGTVLLQAQAEPDAADEAATCFPLWDRTYPFEDVSLSGQMDFASLKPGTYTFTLTAASAAGETTLYSAPFTVTRADARHTLIPNDLRGTYPAAEAYLGDGILPFTYRTGAHGQIFVDNGWVGRNIVSIHTPLGSDWRVNRAAVEPFTQALRYLRTTYLHVGGKWDSGILRLNRLVRSYNGPFFGRQEEVSPFLSPHVLGLAVDLNASMGLNGPVPDNWAVFCREISENLTYNGIREKNGLRYYDFTYTGDWGTAYERVPTIVQNYLLYELAFYRAGFFWGVYYDHTCDASHFGLAEHDPSVHTDSPLALRKVFEYIDE